jgi:hypothetical protein
MPLLRKSSSSPNSKPDHDSRPAVPFKRHRHCHTTAQRNCPCWPSLRQCTTSSTTRSPVSPSHASTQPRILTWRHPLPPKATTANARSGTSGIRIRSLRCVVSSSRRRCMAYTMPPRCRACRSDFKWYVLPPLKQCPLGCVLIQVQITPPGKEERALGIMRVLNDALPDVKVRGGAWVDAISGERRIGFGVA